MFDPKDFIGLCRGSCSEGHSEAEYRTAISRALYGVFLWAREELASRGEPVKVTRVEDRAFEHSKVRSRFKQGKFRHDGVLQRLGGLYQLRWKSDYDLDAIMKQEDVVQALEYVNYIESTFKESLFSSPPS